MSQFGIPEPGNDKREPQRGERPKLQFQVRRTGPVPIPPGQLGSDADLLAERLALQWERVANIAFNKLLHRVKANPMYIDGSGKSYWMRQFHTVFYVQKLPKE